MSGPSRECLLTRQGEVGDVGVGVTEVARLALAISEGYVQGKWAIHLHVRLRGPGIEPKRYEFVPSSAGWPSTKCGLISVQNASP